MIIPASPIPEVQVSLRSSGSGRGSGNGSGSGLYTWFVVLVRDWSCAPSLLITCISGCHWGIDNYRQFKAVMTWAKVTSFVFRF